MIVTVCSQGTLGVLMVSAEFSLPVVRRGSVEGKLGFTLLLQ